MLDESEVGSALDRYLAHQRGAERTRIMLYVGVFLVALAALWAL